ncbi:MAG: hypothetical protein E3J81_07430 [Dehalococcoidia bacterium]|nr:MAG: hypothetical protein E3J81_07430 [Dehalococcoidia bacterium]
MIFPEIIAYLLTLKYPGSEDERTNWVCYRGVFQIILPLMPPYTSLNYTVQPLHGVFAWLAYSFRLGTDMVPNTLSGTIQQYGSVPWSGILTQRGRDDPAEYLLLITEQEPAVSSITNISPLIQRWESLVDFIVIPSQQDLVTVMDALRRLHTSKQVEELLRHGNELLGKLAGEPLGPRPSIGGSS